MMRKSENFKFLVLLSVVIGLLVGCGRNITSPQEVAGEYIYRYRTGEIEDWVFRDDYVYKQEFYRNLDDFKSRNNAVYTNAQIWSYDHDTVTMKGCLIFIDYAHPDQPRTAPANMFSMSGKWVPASSQSAAGLWIAPDINYGLLQIKDRNDVK